MVMSDTVEDLFMYKGLGCESVGGSAVGPPSMEMSPTESASMVEERPGSALSTASRASSVTRIPRLNRESPTRSSLSTRRAASMRLSKGEAIRAKEGRHNHGSSPKPGLVRSQSFVSSRGMKHTSSAPQSPSTPSRQFALQPQSTPNTARQMSPGSVTPDPPRRLSFSSNHNGSVTPDPPRRFSFTNHRRTHSNSLSERKHSVSHPASPSRGTPDSQDLDDDDDVETASVGSCGSLSSTVSCDAALARHNHHHGNGRDTRYVHHCRHNHEPDPDSYLTPTQRAARKIRELKSQLAEARREVHVRDAEISRLTRELVELRLCKARNTQDEEKIKVRVPIENGDVVSVDGTTPSVPSATPPHKLSATPSEGSEPELSRLMDNMNSGLSEAAGTSATSPATASLPETTSDSVDLARSLADSGHYDDLTSPCLSSRDPFETHRGFGAGSHRTDEDDDDRVRDPWAVVEETETRLRLEFERREEELKRNNMNEYHELKEKHNDKVESLLSKLSDANLKYFELRPQYDHAQERIRELEREVSVVKEELAEAERRHQKMYLQMFIKGQQAARMQQDDEQSMEGMTMSESAMNVCDLMKKLSRTEDELEKLKALNRRESASKNNNNIITKNNNNRDLDPEVTLQFLKSAIYYFLTDKDNSRGHLRAIESILGYSDSEKCSINKMMDYIGL